MNQFTETQICIQKRILSSINKYALMLKPIFLNLGDYRECLLVIWSTLNYTVLTSTTTTVPMHDVAWDPSTVNEFVSVGTAGRHNTFRESTCFRHFIFAITNDLVYLFFLINIIIWD